MLPPAPAFALCPNFCPFASLDCQFGLIQIRLISLAIANIHPNTHPTGPSHTPSPQSLQTLTLPDWNA
ncbi:MAG: hypothetical protein MH252_00025 [Thermosynechococcaceae cyanobacterium MS004]|nr:hypothetical protein [Thermosynechococcaceae cyanobacterium MS004]